MEDVAADVGRAPGSIRNIENGRAETVSDELAEQLAARFGLSLDEITATIDSPQMLPTPLTMNDRIAYNCAEAAAVIGSKVWTIQAAIRHGDLKAAVIGQGYVIPREELELFVERAMQKAAREKKTA